jgi:hypothetical protein
MATVKNWMEAAADEIYQMNVDLCDGSVIESVLVDIIAKHCPVPQGVVVMPVPRCDQCAHWFNESDGVDEYKRGTCRKSEHGVSTDPFEDGFNLWVEPDFGCVKFEDAKRMQTQRGRW